MPCMWSVVGAQGSRKFGAVFERSLKTQDATVLPLEF